MTDFSICVDTIVVIQRGQESSLKAYNSALEAWTVDLIQRIEDLLADQVLKYCALLNRIDLKVLLSTKTVGKYSSSLLIDLIISIQILNIPTHTHSERTLSRHIFTLGEVAQLSYARLTNKLFLLLQCVVFFKEEGAEDTDSNVVLFSQKQFECRFVPSDKLRALAVGTLGKMCLQVERASALRTDGRTK